MWASKTGLQARAHPLDDGGEDAGSDNTVPDDDNDDLASFTSQQTTDIQTCDRCSRAPLGAVCSLMVQPVLELEVLFEDNGVRSGAITDTPVLERAVYEQRALVQPQPTAPHSWLTSKKEPTCYSISPSPIPSPLTPVNSRSNSSA